MAIGRRRFIASACAAGMAWPSLSTAASEQSAVNGLIANSASDQTDALQSAIDLAARSSGRLELAPGQYLTRTLNIPGGMNISGVPGVSMLIQSGDGPLLLIEGVEGALITGILLDGSGASGQMWHGGLIHVARSENIILRDCAVTNTALNAITVMGSNATVDNCQISGSDFTGIFVYDANGVRIVGNRVSDCGNGGVRVWRGEPGQDGTIVSGNQISGIDWTEGGNGQNGNGINVFHADGVIVSNNAMSDCGFSAIRLNTTNNTVVSGNTCISSGEVAIFSEFGFSGSIISGNIVDGASAGISMTNLDTGGHLAVCTGNIVRNLTGPSPVNPDLQVPYGIAAEADAIIADNVVDSVEGVGILAGWGPYLRNVTVRGNMVLNSDIGLTASVAEGAGHAIITGNSFSGIARHAMTGNRWDEIASSDLAADAHRYSNLTVSGNTVSQ